MRCLKPLNGDSALCCCVDFLTKYDGSKILVCFPYVSHFCELFFLSINIIYVVHVFSIPKVKEATDIRRLHLLMSFSNPSPNPMLSSCRL
jgi:hypothetical protein